jgi:hypothetical protein
MLARMGKVEEGVLLLVGMKINLVTKEIRLLKKLKIKLPYDPVIPLSGIYPKECKSTCKRDICTSMFIAALFLITKIWNQPRCPTTNN